MSAVPAAERPGRAIRLWWSGARPRTLGVGAVPVLVGAAASGHPKPLPTLAALGVAIGLQVGANFANDYFDGLRGVDTAERIGPPRLTARGSVPARAVLSVAAGCLLVAAGLGVWVALINGLWQLVVAGGVALAAALLYTGGPRPYAAMGVIADLAVFAFFGLMATVGTTALQGAGVPAAAWWAGGSLGLLAVAVLVANNLRDLATDAKVERRTLVVRLGDRGARVLYASLAIAGTLVVTGIGIAVRELPVPALLAFCAAPALIAPLRLAADRSRGGRGIAPLLPLTARLHLAAGVMLALGLLVAMPGGTPLLVALVVGLLLAAGLTAADLLPEPAPR
ncbi:MAG TPA: 1,4-dihydroxy-2-naphthoate octaprenyltransferase [Candidatus Binatia bacterium]|nr:1,4-dihydroxy-2-naphthoate octaprenyltransferase [Candidatus Binatia bacterium]